MNGDPEKTQHLHYLTTEEVQRIFRFDPEKITKFDHTRIRSKLVMVGDRQVRVWLEDDCAQEAP